MLKRNEVAKRDVELDGLQIALRDNIITPEVKANGLGSVDMKRLDDAIEQIAVTYKFKGDKPKAADVLDPSFLPAAAERKVP